MSEQEKGFQPTQAPKNEIDPTEYSIKSTLVNHNPWFTPFVTTLTAAEIAFTHVAEPLQYGAYVQGIEYVAAVGISVATAMTAGRKIPQAIERRLLEKKKVTDPNLEDLDIHPIIYRGKSTEIGGIRLNKSDRILYAPITRFYNGPNRWDTLDLSDNEQLIAFYDFYNQEVRKIKDALRESNTPYKAVALAIPDIDLPHLDELQEWPETTMKDILNNNFFLKRKNDRKDIQEPNLLLLTPDEFLEMSLGEHDAVEKMLLEVNDYTGMELARIFYNTQYADEAQTAGVLLKKHFQTILKRELDIHFNGPSMARAPISSANPRGRERIYNTLQLQFKVTDNTQTMFVQFVGTDGTIFQRSVNDLLGMEKLSLQDILKSRSPLKTAQVMYSLLRILNDHTDYPEFYSQSLSNDPMHFEPKDYIDYESVHAAGTIHPKKFIPAALLGAILTAASYGALAKANHIPQVQSATQNIDIKIDKLLTPEKKSAVYPQTFSLPSQNDGHIGYYPENEELGHRNDWQIAGNMDASGYYIQSTSSRLANGQWQIEKRRSKQIELPQLATVTDNNSLIIGTAYTVEQKLVNKLKLPIKNGTTVAALRVTDAQGNPVPYEAYELVDGTIEVNIPQNPADNTRTVAIYELLLPSQTSQVHAVEPVNPIDIQKLSKSVKQEIEEARSTAQNEKEYFQVIATIVSKRHLYSLYADIGQQQKLAAAKTPEEVTNVIDAYLDSLCNTSNTQAVLMDTAFQSNSSFLNIAVGYLSGVGNPASSTNIQFLAAESLHMFGVDESGNIYDATSSQTDPQYEQHRQNQTTPTPTPSPTPTATPSPVTQPTPTVQPPAYTTATPIPQASLHNNETTNNHTKESDDQKRLFEIIGLAAAGSLVTYLGALQARKFLHRAASNTTPVTLVTPQGPYTTVHGERTIQLHNDPREEILNQYSREDMLKNQAFFLSLFWDKQAKIPNYLKKARPRDVLSNIEKSVNFERLDEYIHNPEKFEPKTLTDEERGKLRLLALYLLK